MKDLALYLAPVALDIELHEESLGAAMYYHLEDNFPSIESGGVAIIYCPEDRGATAYNSLPINDGFRKSLAHLSIRNSWKFPIYDLGTILPGERIEDTYFALRTVVSTLLKKDVIPVVIGGSQDLTYALYEAYQSMEQVVNIISVDSTFDLGDPDQRLDAQNYLGKILLSKPCILFNQSTIGIQAPYTLQSEVDLFEKLFFDTLRLGDYNANFKNVEPILRNGDLLSIDMNSVRYSDFKSKEQRPNGFYADQICQIAKYSGISDKNSCFGLFNLDASTLEGQGHQLVAEIIWYYLDGISQRMGDFPIGSKKDYFKFMVHSEQISEELVFYKSPKSGRWWLEVPYPSKKGVHFARHQLVPCNPEDYEFAMQGELPDLWWKTYQKLH